MALVHHSLDHELHIHNRSHPELHRIDRCKAKTLEMTEKVLETESADPSTANRGHIDLQNLISLQELARNLQHC